MAYQLLTRETLFNLAFETETIISLELSLPLYRVQAYDKYWNLEDLKVNLDLLEDILKKAQIWMAMHPWQATHYFNSKVKEK